MTLLQSLKESSCCLGQGATCGCWEGTAGATTRVWLRKVILQQVAVAGRGLPQRGEKPETRWFDVGWAGVV